MQEMRVQSLGQEDPLEKVMATHSNILAWRIPQKSLADYSRVVTKSQTPLSGLTLLEAEPQVWTELCHVS